MKRVLFALLLIAILITPVWADSTILLLFGEINSIYIASPQTVTPAYGDELVTNGEFTTNTTGWSAVSGATLTRRDFTSSPDIDPTGGVDNYGLEIKTDGTSTSRASQNISVTAGQFYRSVVRSYEPSTNTSAYARMFVEGGVADFLGNALPQNTWNEMLRVGLCTSGGTRVADIRCNSGSANDVIYYDAYTVKQITRSSMLGDVRTAASSGTFTAAWPTAPTNGHRVGLIICLDSASSPQNFIMASLDGTNAYLAKWVGGTWTNLISSASAFAAGNLLEIIKDGNSVQLWHKGVQVGTTQTISDAGVTSNTKFCWFTTNGALKPTYAQWVR